MSDPINANPTVLDISQLPKRSNNKFDGNDNNNNKSIDKLEEIEIYGNLLPFSLIYSGSKYDVNSIEDDLSITPDLISDHSSDEDSLNEDIDNDKKEKEDQEEDQVEPIDAQEIYDLISTISDPEHPLTLGQLAVVNLNDIKVTDPIDKSKIGEIIIKITPTITHCSLATLIGLGIKVRLTRSLPKRFRILIYLKEGSHQSENQVNKQLNDKERVSAACENEQLLKVISHMLSTCQ